MRTERNPDQTRRTILQAAFQEIYRNGFQGASLDNILNHTGLTKGALYHHFPNKSALGYAVVEEVIAATVHEHWVRPLEDADDPISRIQQSMRDALVALGPEMIVLGCPLNNLAQEMSPLDEGFRVRLDRVFQHWRDSLAAALERGKHAGTVRADVEARETALLILAAQEGCLGVAKNAQNMDLLRVCARGLSQYLDTLRA